MVVEAKPEHAEMVCEVIRESIEHLCIEDHHNDPSVLGAWLKNKTPENCTLWINSKHSNSFVFIVDESPVGISLVGENGYVYLCYVHPDHIGKGIGRCLLSACEKQALSWGLEEITVDSSYTGKPFYESEGFKRGGEPSAEGGLCSYPLAKQLSP